MLGLERSLRVKHWYPLPQVHSPAPLQLERVGTGALAGGSEMVGRGCSR